MGLFGASEAPQESLPLIITDHCHTAYVVYSLTKLLEGNLTHFFSKQTCQINDFE